MGSQWHLYLLPLLVLLATAAAPSTAQFLEDTGDDTPLVAAMASAGPECSQCSLDASTMVCAGLPNAPGIRQNVMGACLARCQGFTDIQDGPCTSSDVTTSKFTFT